jgi:hypothetical protein
MKAYKARRRDEAKARQEKRDGRTESEQLKLLSKRSGESKKERRKLLAKIEKNKVKNLDKEV